MGLIRRIAIQILHCLVFLHENHLIHCDLKPENILLKTPNKSGIKVIDFGSSCFEDERVYTYIQSRFYRAPEIMLGIPYTCAIDMWSLGCILAELWNGLPVFPGDCESEQFCMIMEICGLPPKHMIKSASRKNVFFDNNGLPIINPDKKGRIRVPGSKTLYDKLRLSDENFASFISKCLEWNPQKRMTPLEALSHPWIIEGLPPSVLEQHKKNYGLNIILPKNIENVEIEQNEDNTGIVIRKKKSRIKINNESINLSGTNELSKSKQIKNMDSTYAEILKMKDAIIAAKKAETNKIPLEKPRLNKSAIVENSEKQSELVPLRKPSKIKIVSENPPKQITEKPVPLIKIRQDSRHVITTNNTPIKPIIQSHIIPAPESRIIPPPPQLKIINKQDEIIKIYRPRRIMQPDDVKIFKQRRLNIQNPSSIMPPTAPQSTNNTQIENSLQKSGHKSQTAEQTNIQIKQEPTRIVLTKPGIQINNNSNQPYFIRLGRKAKNAVVNKQNLNVSVPEIKEENNGKNINNSMNQGNSKIIIIQRKTSKKKVQNDTEIKIKNVVENTMFPVINIDENEQIQNYNVRQYKITK